MDLYDFYEKYCLESCSERQIYSPFHEGQIGICHNCRLASFIGTVNELTTRYTYVNALTEDDEQVILRAISEIAEEKNIELDESFRVIISYGLQSYSQMKNLCQIFASKEQPPK